jgi:hypothetical protein
MDQNVALYSVRPSRTKLAPGIAEFSYLREFQFGEENNGMYKGDTFVTVYIPLLETLTEGCHRKPMSKLLH